MITKTRITFKDYVYFLFLLILYGFKKITNNIFRTHRKKRKINGKHFLTPEEGNKIIYDLLQNNKPFFVSRFGSAECNIMVHYFAYKLKLIKKISDGSKAEAKHNSGMFSLDLNGYKKFTEYVKRSFKQITSNGFWFIPFEDIFLKMFGNKSMTYFDPLALDCFDFEIPWTYGLRGKKVLVVSSYAKTIESQYKKREFLFKNKKMLPEFKLITYTPVISSGENRVKYKTWEEALLKMRDDILKLDFEVALLSCGSYGVPLSGLLKEKGKSVIYVGGVLQIYFGIKGKRWDRCNPFVNKYYNVYWVRSKENKPVGSEMIEGSCYW